MAVPSGRRRRRSPPQRLHGQLYTKTPATLTDFHSIHPCRFSARAVDNELRRTVSHAHMGHLGFQVSAQRKRPSTEQVRQD